MNLLIVTIIVSLLVALWNWFQVERLNHNPHNIYEWIGRFGIWVGFTSGFTPDWKWFWVNLICTAFIFWFVFDYSLNLMRGRPLIHLGNSPVDRLQTNYGGPFVWFVWKAIIAAGAAAVLINPGQLYGGY